MFDRSVALRDSQLDFLDNVCLPLYEDVVKFSVELQPLVDACRANRHQWARKSSAEFMTTERDDLAQRFYRTLSSRSNSD